MPTLRRPKPEVVVMRPHGMAAALLLLVPTLALARDASPSASNDGLVIVMGVVALAVAGVWIALYGAEEGGAASKASRRRAGRASKLPWPPVAKTQRDAKDPPDGSIG